MGPQPTPKELLDHVRHALRLKHYSYRTEQAYVGWITRYILLHDKRHPSDMDAPKVEAFLSHPKAVEHAAAGTSAVRPVPISERPTIH